MVIGGITSVFGDLAIMGILTAVMPLPLTVFDRLTRTVASCLPEQFPSRSLRILVQFDFFNLRN